jgi:gliding motility-associated-like protein
MRFQLQKLFIVQFLLILSGSAVKAQNCQAVITHGSPLTFCQGDSVQLTANPGRSYQWSNGKNTPSIYASKTGNYSVTVTDNNGCVSTSTTLAATAMVAPDAALQDTVDNFMNCTYSSGGNFRLTVDNISSTKATNTKYTIDWGDGGASIFGTNFNSASHTYLLPGSFNLTLTVTNAAGCSSSKSYLVFNGSNPSFGVASQGNTNDCAPATFTFDIINTLGNTPSTVYTFQFDDGTPALYYTNATLPKTITHTFTQSAYGKPGNSFTLTAYATNPCGTTPATVGGIRISGGPVADFLVNPDTVTCVNKPVKLTDVSAGGFNANATGTNTSAYTREWKIRPATGWSFINGTNANMPQPELTFTQPGVYEILLIATPRGTGAKCSGDTTSKKITIYGLPTAGFQISKPNGTCTPAVVSLTNQSTGSALTYNWEVLPATGWAFSGQTTNTAINPELTFSEAGSYHIKLTTSNLCGQTAVADSVVVIQGVPMVALPDSQQYCNKQTVVFSTQNPAHKSEVLTNGSAISAYDWQITGTPGATFVNGTTATSQTPEINFPAAGTYYVIFKAANACGFSQPDTQTVIINPLPAVKVVSTAAAICAGQGVATLTASGATSYTWFPATGLSATKGNIVIANPTTTTTYTVTGTNTLTGCSDSTTITVIVKPAIPLTLTTSASKICIGQQTATLTATGADKYTWSPAAGLSDSTGATVIANPSVTTIYTVTALDTTAGCIATKTIKIEVVPLPVITIGSDTTICANGQGIQLKGYPNGGTWTGQNVAASGLFVGSAAGTYNVTYSFTNANGCFASASKKITVTPLPVVSAGNDTTFCAQNGTILFIASPSGGVWTGSSQINYNGHFASNVPGTYTLTYTYGSGNCLVSDQKKVTVLALPVAPILANQQICPATSASITAQGNAVRYEWYDALLNGNLLFTGKTFTTPTLQTSKTYYVVAYNTEGCATPFRTPVQVIVNPVASAPVAANVIVCGPGSQATFTASGSTGTYEWFDAAVNGNLLFTGASFQTPAISNTTNYYLQAVSAEGCRSFTRTQVTATVIPSLANNTLTGTQTICEGVIPAQFNGSTPTGGNGNYTFTWESSTDSLNFSAILGAGNNASLTSNALQQTTWFRRKVTSGPCSEYSALVKVTVIPKPAAPVLTNQTICAGSVANLVATGASLKFEWFTTQSVGQAIFSGNQFNTPSLQTSTEYFVEAINSQGCRSTSRGKVTVTVLPVIANNFITTDQTICASETPSGFIGSVPAGGNGNYTFLWESSTDNVNFTPATGTNTGGNYSAASLTQTTWFRRIVISGPCQNNTSAPVKITVIPALANNNITSQPQTICAGTLPQSLQATQPAGGTGTYTYQWQLSTTSATQGFVPAQNTNNNQNYTPAALQQTTWFRRVVYSGNCSEISAAVKVEVVPVLANNIIASSQTIYAGNTPTLLTGSQPAGGNGQYQYEWEISTISNNSGFTTLSASGTTYQPGAITQTSWFRRIVRSGDCDLVSNAVEITVVPAVSNNAIQKDQVICQNNQPSVLQGSQPVGGVGNYTYLWESSITGPAAGFTTATGIANQAAYQPGILTQTTWFRRKVVSGAYTHTSNAVEITVNPNIANNTIGFSQTICAGSAPAVLTGTTPSGGTGAYIYLWEMSTTGNANSFVTAPGVNNGINYNTENLQQTTWFRRKVSAGFCANSISAAVKIMVNVVPAPPTLAPIEICSGSNAVLQLSENDLKSSEAEIEWYENAYGGQLLSTGLIFTTPALTQTKTYYVQTVKFGCASERTAVTVKVREATADAGEDLSIISGKSGYLKAQGGISYKWSPAEGLNKTNVANPIASPAKTTTYTVEVVSEYGCVSTDQVTVTVLPKIKLVNTFTPNNDGINDTWEIKGLEEYKNCQVEIFNRWGAKVFSSTGYPQPWNGLSATGEELPVATYYYIIYLNKEEAPVAGSVTIVR